MIVLLLTMVALLAQAADDLAPGTRDAIAPVIEAIAAETERQAALPPPASDRERLERMGRLDQAGRWHIGEVDVSALPPEQRGEAFEAIGRVMGRIDAENQAALMTMIPEEGWFLRSRYGDEAATAAFRIVQHGDEELWRRFLPVLQPLVESGEVAGESFAMMYDRLAISEGRPQRYGTQFVCVEDRWTLAPLENPDEVEALRAEMDIAAPLSALVAHMEQQPPCA